MKKIIRIVIRFIARIVKFFDKYLITPVMRLVLKISDLFKDTNKTIEVILNNKKVLLVLSLIFAFLIFYFFDSSSSLMLNNYAERLYNIPVEAYYNEEAYVIEGVPESADIILFGNSSYITLAKQYPSPTITVDLRELTPGTHKVYLNYENYFDFVEYKVDPSYITVVISDKVSATRELSYEILHRETLDSKLDITAVSLSKTRVTVKSSKEMLDKVAYVKALIDVDNLVNPVAGTATINGAKLVAYDDTGNVLDVEILPETVDAELTLASNSKMVPIKVIPEGDLALGYAIESLSPSSNSIMIYGSEENLSNIECVEVYVNVNNLNADKTFNVNVTKPNGVREIGLKTLSVKVKVTEEKQIEVENVHIEAINLATGFKAQLVSEKDSNITVVIKGAKDLLDALDTSTLTAVVDLSGYTKAGEYEVPVTVSGSDVKLNYISKTAKIKIKITQG